MLRRYGREGDGRGVGKGIWAEVSHHHCHVGWHALLTPRPVAHLEPKGVAGGGEEKKLVSLEVVENMHN